jgi:hypothetical protein
MRLWQILYISIYIMDVRDPHEETGSQTCGALASLGTAGCQIGGIVCPEKDR